MSDSTPTTYTLPADHFDSMEGTAPPRIVKFGGTPKGGAEVEGSVQVQRGTALQLAWQIDGTCDSVSIEGTGAQPASGATSLSDTPQSDVTYVLHAKNQYGEHTASLIAALHDEGETVSEHIDVAPKAAGAIAQVAGDDVLIDPPVRLLPQWPKERYGLRQLAGADGKPLYWKDSGCGPSSAATVLRWFAEDCKAGHIDFPTKEGSDIDPTFYGPRMAQAFWPDGFHYYKGDKSGNPIGKVELDNSGVDNAQLQNKAAKLLGKDKAHRVTSAPAGGWLPLIRELLKTGPVIVGIGPPSPAGHYIVAQGVKGGALLIADPGNVLYQAWNGQAGFKSAQYMPPKAQWPKGPPANGYEDDPRAYAEVSGALLNQLLAGLKSVTSLSYPDGPVLSGGGGAAPAQSAPAQQDAAPAQPDAPPQGDPDCQHCAALQKLIGNGVESKVKRKGDEDCVKLLQYHLDQFGYDLGSPAVDGDFGSHTAAALKAFLAEAGVGGGCDALSDDAANAVLQKHKAGFKKTAQTAPPAQPAADATQAPATASTPGGDLEQFFAYQGNVGEGSKKRDYTYKAYRVKGNSPWFMRGRCMVDFDGAPNCYGKPDGSSKVLPLGQYPTVDIMSWTGALDSLGDAKSNDGTWSAVVLGKDGQPITQKDSDPFPGFCISTVLLTDSSYPATDPRHYADARVFPYFAMPAQILKQSGVWYSETNKGHSGNFGDYITAVNTRTLQYGHGLIGDTGNKPEFGEGSYALDKSIGILYGEFEPDVLYIVYPATGAGQTTIPDLGTLKQKGDDLFSTFGGIDEVKRVLGLMK